MKNLRITVRIKESDRQKIEKLINERKFSNMSMLVRVALEKFFKERV